MSAFDLLRYNSKGIPGKAIKRPAPSDVSGVGSTSKKKYETTRKERQFQESWLKNRGWLLYDKEANIMKCNVCVEYNSSCTGSSNLKNANKFITGSNNFKLSTVTDHEDSPSHQNAASKMKARSSSLEEINHSKAGKALQLLNSSQRHRLAYLFRGAHAVAKTNKSLSDYNWVCELYKASDVDIGNTYLNRRAALDFITAISSAEKKRTSDLLSTGKYFSFMMDGTTDISGDEQEAIYVRTSINGVVHERFLRIGTPISTCSEDLMTFCIDTFEQCCIQKEKLVGMGTDGASNMVGVKKGLAALMKQRVNPSMVNIHCLAHRLELAFRDVLKSNKLYERLMTLLIGLHYFYKKYYKNKSGLLRAMKAVDIKGTLPPKVTGTRWLPHLQKGLKSLFKTFKAYEAHLSTLSHTNPKAEGMLKMLLDRELVAFALFLQSTLEPLMTLSMKLQSPKITLADSMFWVETQADLLDEVKLREIEDVNEVLSNGTFQKVQLKGREPTMRYKEKIIDSLKESMLRRFDWEDTSVINATKITNLYKWPACDNPAFIEFGVEEVRLFGQHFQSTLENAYPGYDVETAVGEWRTLKRAATKRYGCKLIQMTWA